MVHDEWQDKACRTFRTVLDIRIGEQWRWNWFRVAFGSKFSRAPDQPLLDLVKASDETKGQVACRATRALTNSEVILDLWSEPRRIRGRYDVDIPFHIDDSWDPNRLQIVQTCLIKGHRDPKVGRPLPSDPSFRCFVDNGAFSPARLGNGLPRGHPQLPYYFRPRELATEIGPGEIRHFDSPKDVELAAESYFEAVLVHASSHCWEPDHVLQVVRFGWVQQRDGGPLRRCPEPGADLGYKDFWPAHSPSQRFFEIVRLDYPRYKLKQ